MDINTYIIQLLYDHDRVTLPGLGAFIGFYQSAKMDQGKNTISPPVKIIKFDPKLTADDEHLADTIVLKQGVTKEEANRIIREYVNRVTQSLNKTKHYVFNKIGKLIQLGDGELILEPAGELTFLYDSFGMKPLLLTPLQGQSPQKEDKKSPTDTRTATSGPGTTPKPTATKDTSALQREIKSGPKRVYDRKKTINRIAIITPVVVLLIFLFVYLNLEKRTEGQLNFNMEEGSVPEQKQESTEVVGEKPAAEQDPDEPEVEKKIDEITEKKQALYYQEPVITEKYYIIAGSFSKFSNADTYKRQLADKGFNPRILERNGEGFRVSIGEFNTKSTALEELMQLRNQYNQSVWLLTRQEKQP